MDFSLSPVELCQRLVRTESVSPDQTCQDVADLLANILRHGFQLSFVDCPGHGPSLLACLPGQGAKPPICFTGHLDTVPLGNAAWSKEPFGGEILDGMLYGRGSCDMKSGVAACVSAALELAKLGKRSSDVWLIFTSAEELGCLGAQAIAASGLLPKQAGALVVAEPTGCEPLYGHKGALWLRADFSGKSAHGSMPEAGDNAICKACRAVTSLEDFFAAHPGHPGLGKPTLNIGTIHGGGKTNMVPDAAYFEIDVRSVAGQEHGEIEKAIADRLGPQAKISRMVDMPWVATETSDPWLQSCRGLLSELSGRAMELGSVSYFTDASVLWPAMGNPPTLICGPGPAGQAHQTDEHCPVAQIELAARTYYEIGLAWLA